MRTATYVRYSSDQQSAASLDDQLRNCRAYCARQGWPAPEVFSDAAVSGARNDRPGYRRLLAEAQRFDVIVVDDLSRLSRDSVEAQQQVRRLTFAGVRLIGVSDGVDTGRKSHKADVGLRGLMGELYLDDLKEKTHRGLMGRALSGASAGGLPYGYTATGVGARAINEAQAAVVRRIYADYLAGMTPRTIASNLNAEGVPSPRGSTWSRTAIYCDAARGIGILANPIYAGRQVWNRSHWVKHPDTGRRVRRERPESEWVVTEHPELAIVDADTWERAQRKMQRSPYPKGTGRPPTHILSGILRCGECGGPMVITDAYNYSCSVAKDRGASVCPSRVRLRRKIAERALFAGIREELLTEEAFQRFQRAVTAALKRHAPDIEGAKRRHADAAKVRDNIMAAIRAGIITPTTKAELTKSEGDVAAALAQVEAMKRHQPATFLPRARERWEAIVNDLTDYSRNVPKARAALRDLIGENVVVKYENGDLVAEIAASPDAQIMMVAGACSGRYLRDTIRIPLGPAI